MILYHVTLFNKPTQEILIPRIPEDTSIGEEVKTNRICLAPSIIQCLRALEIYKYFQEDTLDVKVYKIVVDENDEQLISWEHICHPAQCSFFLKPPQPMKQLFVHR